MLICGSTATFKVKIQGMTDKQQIRVSYLITTRNRAEYLQRTLDNVREFITPEDELIVIDGGSTDDTVKILERNRDVVTFYLSEPDRGEAHAFNKGLFRARGRYIKPITDDDFFDPAAMRLLVAAMEAHPEIDALIAGGEKWALVDGKAEFHDYYRMPLGVRAGSVEGFWCFHIGLALIMRREVVELCGGVSISSISVDGDLASRIIRCGLNYRYLDVNLFRWHNHPHSVSNRARGFEDNYREFRWRLSPLQSVWTYMSKLPEDERLKTLYLPTSNAGIKATTQLLFWQMEGLQGRRSPCAARLLGALMVLIRRILNSIYALRHRIDSFLGRTAKASELHGAPSHGVSPTVLPWSGELR